MSWFKPQQHDPVPNLDQMTVPDLVAFHDRHIEGEHWRELTELRDMPKHEAVRAESFLAAYAGLKAKAMTMRLGGNIPYALLLEEQCDWLYHHIPLDACW